MTDTRTETWRDDIRREFIREILSGLIDNKFEAHTKHYLTVLLKDLLHQYGFASTAAAYP